MRLLKLFFYMVCFTSLPVLAANETVYGTWIGKANYQNSYTPMYGVMPDPKYRSSMPLKGTRSVKLTISKGGCKISFGLDLNCIYVADKKIVVIPEWRDKASVYDSGLMIMKLTSSTLEIKNEYTRVYGDAENEQHARKTDSYKFEMKGSELYRLTRSD